MRRTLAVVVAGLAAALSGVVLGEYELTWKVGTMAGAGVALVLTEVVATLGRWRGAVAATATSVLAVGAMAWAGRIDSNEGLRPFPMGAWVGMAVAVGVAAWRLRPAGQG